MKKLLFSTALLAPSFSLYAVEGSLKASLGVEREGPQIGLDYLLPAETYESYKTYFRYQSSGISSNDSAAIVGVAAGLHGQWGQCAAAIYPGMSINLIDNQGASLGPSLEISASYYLDSQITIGFSKFENWIWVGKTTGLWNSSFLFDVGYRL